MASIQKKTSGYYCQFLFHGRRRTIALGHVTDGKAEAFCERAEELLGLLKRGRLTLPEGTDVAAFIEADGRVEAKASPALRLTVAELSRRYAEAHRESMEANSLGTAEMHLRHFAGTLGASFDLARLTLPDLQSHVTQRRAARYRGRNISPATLKMEVTSLRAAWNWACVSGLASGAFPSKGLLYPKADQKPPFMTRDEILKRIAAGERPGPLWESLYLRREEVGDLLSCVRGKGPPWLYPLVAVAAYTGARRSELLRLTAADVDLDAGLILIHEKKRNHKQRTTRRVSVTPALAAILTDWLAAHPGGKWLFCQGALDRSKKRSRTTGHGGDRPTTNAARAARVRARDAGVLPVTKDEAHDHLKRALRGTAWKAVRGYHVLRHSCCSILAAAGVDQRIIDDLLGHQTDEQRKRYRHLVPDVKQAAISAAFG